MTIKNRVIVIFKKFWKLKWLRIPVLTFLFLYLCFQYNFLWLMGSMPSVEELKDPKLPVASELYAANGELIGKYFHEIDDKLLNIVQLQNERPSELVLASIEQKAAQIKPFSFKNAIHYK